MTAREGCVVYGACGRRGFDFDAMKDIMKRPMRVRIEGILKTQTGGDIRHEARGSARPTCAYGGDWFRHGTFELRSRSWSPRHVKQGYRQVNWQI